MVLVLVQFNTQFCSMVVDGRLPLYEGTRQGLFMIPEDMATEFCSAAIKMDNVTRAVVYRYFKTFNKR